MVEIAVNMSQLDRMCRLCLSTGVALLNIFQSPAKTKSRVADLIMQCAPVKIKKCDEMPNFICRLCYTKLEKNHQFQTQIVQSEKTLRRYIQQLHTSDGQIKTECSEHFLIRDVNAYNATVNSQISTECADNTVERFSRNDNCEISCEDTKNDFDIDLNWKEKEHANFNSENKVKEETTFNFGIKDELITDDNSLNTSERADDLFDNFSKCYGGGISCKDPIIDMNGTLRSLERTYSADTIGNFDKREEGSKNSLVNNESDKEACKLKYECDFCNKSFLYPSTLKNHYRTHTGEKPFECEVCNKRFALLNTLKTHTRTHTDEKPYQCHICKRQFAQLSSLSCHKCTGEKRSADEIEDSEKSQPKKKKSPVNENHKKANTAEYKCGFCNKCFPSPSSLNTHSRMHTGEKPYQCDVCYKSFAQLHHLKRHSSVHTDKKPYQCDICNKQFMKINVLNRHKLKHTGEQGSADEIQEFEKSIQENENDPTNKEICKYSSKIEYKCEVCNKCFPHLVGLKKHKRIHLKPYKCDICNKQFSELTNLRRHKYTHTGEKRFMCDVCSRRFTEMAHLNNHKRTHTGEKPYQCDVCNRYFAYLNDLSRHKRTHTGEKPYKCDVCNKQFVQSQHLKVHKRTHTGEKPYECDVCNKRFARASCVKIHKRTHTGERPYPCDVCNKSFTSSRHLSTHKRIHTGEKPYRCDVCNMCFTYSFSLKKHKTTHL